MESVSASSLPGLLKLYKDREVRRLSTFADVAGQLDPGELASAYVDSRNSAPRRHDRNKAYFVDHSGLANRAAISNRREEHLALALWRDSATGNPMVLPSGVTLEILDYQVPLKARQTDKGVGKLDLFGLQDECRAAVIELKVRPASQRYGDNPLHAYLEALAYCAIVEANMSGIASEASARFSRSVVNRPPSLIVMAPDDYWTEYARHPKAGNWWPALNALANEIDQLLNMETHFVGLRDVAFRMGTRDHQPRLTGDFSVVSVHELIRA